MPQDHQRTLVTGVAGFVGSHLAEKLVSQGTQVTGIDSLLRGRMENVRHILHSENFSFTRGDILNRNPLHRRTRDIDIIYHEAALIDVNESVQKPKLYQRVNVRGLRNVLEAARTNDVKRTVFASSCAVYGEQSTLPIRDDAQLKPTSP